jgi:hypothetical protein
LNRADLAYAICHVLGMRPTARVYGNASLPPAPATQGVA